MSAVFCPTCKSEYREGFRHCPSCDVDLVALLPEPETPPAAPDGPSTVLMTVNSSEAALIQSVLEGSGIDAAVLDENLARMETPFFTGGMKLIVPKDQEQLALEVLEEYRGRTAQASGKEEGNSDNDEYRCVHCKALLEPETLFCVKCGRQPFE